MIRHNEYSIKNTSNAAIDTGKKFPKVWDKLGWRIAVFATVTG